MPPNKLAGKLVEVMRSVESVPKNGYNDYHKYEYALEADIMRAVRGKLGELGVLVLTSVESTTRQAHITEVSTKHTFIDTETGETLDVKGYGQGADTGDKGGYKAITGAVKYFLTKTFLLPTGDDPEKEDGNPPAQPARNGTPKPSGNGKPAAKPQTGPTPATKQQEEEITRLARELGLDVNRDIYAKMQITCDFKAKTENHNGLQCADLCAYPLARSLVLKGSPSKAADIVRPKIYANNGRQYGLKIFPHK